MATSDGLEQVIILGQGANRMSAPGLKEEIERTLAEVRGEHLGKERQCRKLSFFDYPMKRLQRRWKKSDWGKQERMDGIKNDNRDY